MKNQVDLAQDELLTPIEDVIHSYMRLVILEGRNVQQTIANQLDNNLESANKVGLMREHVVAALKRILRDDYGKNKLVNAIADAIVTGEGID